MVLGKPAPEREHGVFYNQRPFKGRAFYLTPSFINQQLRQQLDPSIWDLLIEKVPRRAMVHENFVAGKGANR